MAVPSLTVGGMEVMVARLAAKLAARKHDVGITCVEAGGPLTSGLAEAGVRVRVVEAHGFLGPDWLRRLSRHFREVAPDVLHAHSGCWLKAALAGRRAGIRRTIHTAHGFVADLGWKQKLSDRAAVPFTSRIVAVSEHLKQHLLARGIPAAKLCVIPNGIDTLLFREQAATGLLRAKCNIEAGACIIGTVARLEPIKNQTMLIRATALARRSGCKCEAVLVGEGSLRNSLEQQALELGIADKVHFWGADSNVASIYPEFDIFALTSNAEGTSMSLLEAMASGNCPLVTAVGGNIDVLDGGRCGVLVQVERPDEMAHAICRLASDPERRRLIGAKARAGVEARFSEAAMIANYEALYRAC